MGVEQVGIHFVMCIEVDTTVNRLTLSGGTPVYNASQGQNDTSGICQLSALQSHVHIYNNQFFS